MHACRSTLEDPTPTLTLTATRATEEIVGRFALVLNGQRVLGMSASAAAPQLALYPNPASVGGSVRVTGCPVSLPLTVLDLTGRRVATALPDATGVAEVPTRGLAAGAYVVRTPDGRTARLVVE